MQMYFLKKQTMQEKNYIEYEYAMLRLVPYVEREEFINIGIILFSKRKKYLKLRYHLDEKKLKAFRVAFTKEEIEAYLQMFERLCQGTLNNAMKDYELAEKFRWITAVKSSCIQTSVPHPGLSSQALDDRLNTLMEELVL